MKFILGANYKIKNFLLFLFVLGLSAVNAQETVTITGLVTGKNGTPLLGVNVLVKDSNVGTVTDFDGNYELKVKIGDILTVILQKLYKDN